MLKQILRMGEDNNPVFFCPGCKCGHKVWVKTGDNIDGGPIWDWNESMDTPTFNPSVRVRYPIGDVMNICHSFIRDGMIEFCSDSTHNLSGQRVPLNEF